MLWRILWWDISEHYLIWAICAGMCSLILDIILSEQYVLGWACWYLTCFCKALLYMQQPVAWKQMEWLHKIARLLSSLRTNTMHPNNYHNDFKTWKLCITGPLWWNSLVTGRFPTQRVSYVELWCFLCCSNKLIISRDAGEHRQWICLWFVGTHHSCGITVMTSKELSMLCHIVGVWYWSV